MFTNSHLMLLIVYAQLCTLLDSWFVNIFFLRFSIKKKGYGCPLPFLCCHHVHGDPNVLPCASLTVSRRAFLGHPEAGLCAVGGVTGDEVAHEPGVVPTSFLE